MHETMSPHAVYVNERGAKEDQGNIHVCAVDSALSKDLSYVHAMVRVRVATVYRNQGCMDELCIVESR